MGAVGHGSDLGPNGPPPAPTPSVPDQSSGAAVPFKGRSLIKAVILRSIIHPRALDLFAAFTPGPFFPD